MLCTLQTSLPSGSPSFDPLSAEPLGTFGGEAWLLALLVLLGIAAVAALWTLVGRLRRIEAELARAAVLEEVLASVKRLAEAHSDLDLRRLEHVLIDIRDGQKRVEDGLLRVLEAARTEREAQSVVAEEGRHPQVGLPERVTNRLLAQGYERIQIVTSNEDLALLAEGDGEVLVEARRDGAPCKGRVVVRDGAITDVEMKPAYTIFP